MDFQLKHDDLKRALDHVAERDADIARALQMVGYPEERRTGPPSFEHLLRIIVGQQLSVKAAATIFGRVQDALAGDFAPQTLLDKSDEEQRARALAAEQLPEGIFAGPGRKDSLNDYEGLRADALSATQQRLLRVLVEEYIANADFDVAEAQMAAIDEAGWDALWFSWRGPVNAAGRFYYRVHGPRILIEYNRVDENHDHSIVRDPQNDYGADWLGQHLEEHHPSSEDIQQRLRQLTGTPGGG